MMERNERFIKREYRKALFPIMFSVLGGTINTLIDSAFVSQSNGPDALASVNLCMPIYLILCVIGALISNGAVMLSAKEIGKKNQDKAVEIYHSAFCWYLVIGVFISIVGLILARPIATMYSHGGALTEYVFDYAFVTLIGAIPTIMIYLPIKYLQLEGDNKSISIMMVIMIVSDIALDYQLLFVFRLGLTGAALASVLSTLFATVFGFAMLQRGINFKLRITSLNLKNTLRIVRYGFPSAIGNLVDSIKMSMLNSLILISLGSSGVAIWAVLNSLSEISITISTGVPQAASAMIGVYYPSRENSSIRSLVKLQVLWGVILSAGYGLFMIVCCKPIENLFAVNSDMLIPIVCLGIGMILDVFAGIWVKYFNTIGKITISGFINVIRKLVFPVSVAHILVANGFMLWLFLPIAGVLTIITAIGAIAFYVINYKNRKHKKLSPILLLDDQLEIENKIIDFSIEPNSEQICEAATKISDFCEEHHMDQKTLMRLSLAIEELLTVLAEHFSNTKSVDMRAFVTEDETGIQIRIAGEFFDIFKAAEEETEDPTKYMGVTMMKKLANTTNHYYALGINTIHIFFNKQTKEEA